MKLRYGPEAFAVLWLLEEAGCPCDLEIAADFRAPALTDGDTTIHEIGAMVEWICETRAPDLWRAVGAPGRMGWLDWLHFAARLGDPDAQDLATLEKWLQGSDWLLSEFSAVDCMMASACAECRAGPIADYVARCRARAAFGRAAARAKGAV